MIDILQSNLKDNKHSNKLKSDKHSEGSALPKVYINVCMHPCTDTHTHTHAHTDTQLVS